jgi:hypothetical protein
VTQDPILRDMLAQRQEIDRGHRPYETLDEGLAWVERHVKLMRVLQQTPPHERIAAHNSLVRKHALTVMAVSYRLLRDLGLETSAAAIEKEIPF